MTTKELIKLLQEEDPEGNAHVRIDGNPVIYVESKLGYWDGPYSYLETNEHGNKVWVQSTKGYKVDINTLDLFDFAERFNGDWEKMKNHIRIDYDYCDDERKNQFLEKAKKECEEFREMNDKLQLQALEEMKKHALEGWTWFQNKDVDKKEKPNIHKHYTWKIYNEKGKEETSNVWNTQSIMESGDWEKVDNNIKKGYYEWAYKNKK